MSEKKEIPIKNEHGYYDIRMESIGGQGANLAGKIFAEAGVMGMGWNGVSFAAYGSEKKGTPVRTYVRFCDSEQQLRDGSPVEEPHLLVVFHENMVRLMPIMAGVKEDAAIVVNTPKSPEEIRDVLKIHGGKIICVDALKIAIEEKVRINTTILGAVTRAMEFMDREVAKEAIRKTFEKKYPHLVEGNLRGFDRGYEEVAIGEIKPDGKYEFKQYHNVVPEFGYETAPLGGVVLTPGGTAHKDVSASREGFIPKLNKDNCKHCAECDTTCPDMCFVWERRKDDKGKERQFLDHIEYNHCKGCLRCVSACEFDALSAERESA